MGEKKVTTIKMTYDPIYITKMLLQMYAERHIEGKTFRADQFAIYEYLGTQTDEECEQLLDEYAERHKLTEITFKEWEADCLMMMKIIREKQKFKDLLVHYQCCGWGKTGMGVHDKINNKFHECQYLDHWQTLMDILDDNQEFQQLPQNEKDDYIMKNYSFIGESDPKVLKWAQEGS